MNRLRIKNATVFVTVLSACLGLMAAGASSQAHQTASSVLSEIGAVTSAGCSYRQASNQSLKLTARYASHPLPFAFQTAHEPAETLYKNTRPLTGNNQILVVTRRPRASLDDLPA